MKNWKFIKIGNGISISGVGGEIPPESEISKKIYEELKNNGMDKDKAVVALALKYKNIPNARMFFESAVEKVMKSYSNRTVNESIEKQTWSMFKGLAKDAEKEVGNAWTSADEKRLDELARKKATHLSDQEWKEFQELIKRSEQASKDFFKKTGNANTVSEYNAEIQRLTKKAEQLRRMGQGRSAIEVEKQIEKLGKELRELGNKKTGNKIIDLRDPDPTGEVQASAMKRYYKLMDEYEKNRKKVEGIYKDKEGKKYRVYLFGPDSGYRSGNYSITGEGIYSITKVVKDLPSDFVKIGNARPKEQLLADVRELTKYIQEHNGQGCEKEKRLLGEAKEELDKNYGIIVGNKKIGNGSGDWNGNKYYDHGQRNLSRLEKNGNGWSVYFGDGFRQSKRLGTYADENTAREVAELAVETEMPDMIKTKYSSKSINKKSGNETLAEYAKRKPRVINGLSRARNAMTKNAMGIADLEAQIKKNEEYIKSLQGKTVDSEGWSAKASIQEAQDEIDRMKSRIEELKKQGNKKG